MLKMVVRVSIASLFLFILFPYSSDAQIAPTNSATISGSLSDSNGRPLANAKISISGAKTASTQTDAHGLFIFVGVPFGSYELTASASGLGTVARGLEVVGDVNIAIAYNAAIVNGIKVIAQVSSNSSAQFNVTPASITQVSPLAEALAGETSWRTILEKIPGVAEAGMANGDSTLASIPDSPFVPMMISIDGALPYETATLLDDMPVTTANFGNSGAGFGADLSLYPLNGFHSADVIRGPGADAPSIVDSIGGSFMLHPPDVVSHNEYTLSVSTDPYGGIIANTVAAVHWQKLSAVVTYGVNTSPGPLAGATLFNITRPQVGLSTVDGQSFSPYINNFLRNPNYAGFAFTGYQVGLLACCAPESSAWNQHSGSVTLNYAFSPTVNIGLFYVGNISQEGIYPAGFTNVFTPPSGYAGAVLHGSYALDISNTALTPGITIARSSLLEEKITVQLGREVVRLAALQNRTFDLNLYNTGSPLIAPTFQLFGGGYLNGSSNVTVFNGGSYNVTFNPFTQFTTLMSNNRDLLFTYETPLGDNFHAGVSYVKSYYDQPSSQFTDGFNCGEFPSAISQTTNELRLFAGGNPSAKTSLDLSMYFVNADYHVPDPNNPAIDTTTFDNATYVDERYTYAAPRLGFVWRPTGSVAIRAAAGGGFAEAPLNDLIGSNVICNFGSSYEEFKTNIKLQPEKSFGFDLGVDVRLHRDTVFSFDVYHTALYGQIYNSTTPAGTYLGLPLYTVQYGNLGESRMEGILLDVRHNVPHGIYWTLSGGLTRGYVASVPAGFYDNPSVPCTNCANLNVVPNINFNGAFTAVSVPYAQGLGTFGYTWNNGKFIGFTATYFGNNNTYFRPAFVEFDGNIGYPLTKNVSLSVMFRNITGIYDAAVQTVTNNLSGVPSVAGLPYAVYGEQYGPRTVLVTTQIHL